MLKEEIRNIKSEKKDLRNFGLVVGSVLVFIGALLLWKGRPIYPYFFGIGGSLMLLGGLFPFMLFPLQKAWMTLAVILGWFMTRVILFVLFYFIVTPISVVSRLLGKRFLELGWRNNAESYWNYRDGKKAEPDEYEKQF